MGALIDAVFDAASGKSLVLIGEGKSILKTLDVDAPEFFPQIARLREILLLLDAQTEAARQFQAIEQRYTKELQAHAEKGAPLPAPNGAPSNLNRQQWVLARTPNFKRWFGEWEAGENQSSKIVNFNEEPLMVYHGTTADFPEFRDTAKDELGSGDGSGLGHFFTPSSEHASENYAHQEGGNLIPVFLAIKNPIVIDDYYGMDAVKYVAFNDYCMRKYGKTYEALSQSDRAADQSLLDDFFSKNFKSGKGYTTRLNGFIKNQLIAMGYDGIIFIGDKQFEKSSDKAIVAFYPTQIKSAIGNTGTFNPDSSAMLDAVAEDRTSADLLERLDEDAPSFFDDLRQLQKVLRPLFDAI